MRRWNSHSATAWNRFFFGVQPAMPLRMFRAAFGSWLVTYYLRLYEILRLHLDHDGLVTRAELSESMRTGKWSVFAWLAGNETAFHLVFLVAILGAIGLSAGWHVRFAAALNWAANLSLANALVVGTNSGDEIVTILSFLFLLAAIAGHLDTGRVAIPSWSIRLFQIQIVLIYFFSGWLKTASPDWYRGEAMHFVFQQPLWLRAAWEALDNPLVVGFMTYGILAFELVLFPVLVWIRTWRPWVLSAGVLFHVAIAITMKVFVFGELMPITYLAFLSVDSRVMKVAANLGNRLREAILCQRTISTFDSSSVPNTSRLGSP